MLRNPDHPDPAAHLLSEPCLVNLDVAGTSFDSDGGAAAMNFSHDVVFVERSLNCHFLISVN